MAKRFYNPRKTNRHKNSWVPKQILHKPELIKARVLGGAIALCFFLFGVVPAAVGQSPDASPYGGLNDLPNEVPAISQLEEFELPSVGDLLTPVGNYINSAPVRLDGRTIFRVASTESLSAEVRAVEIQQRLHQFADEEFDQDTLDVDWVLDGEDGPPVIYINGEYFLFTVTSLDTRLSGLSDPETRANELCQTIEDALLDYRKERQPEFLERQGKIAGVMLVCMTFASLVLARVQYWLSQRRARAHKISAPPPIDDITNPPANVVTALRQRVSIQQKLSILELKRWFCRLGQFLIWAGGLFLILSLFPYTRVLLPLIFNTLKIPFRVLLVILVNYALIRLANIVIDRAILTLQERTTLASVQSQRLTLRFSTFSQVLKSIVATVLITIGVLSILSILGIQLAPLLAGAGIIGLAISLASQNLLKDIINGFLILLEDQYGVGDVIVVGDVAGFVETMNLRITQLRNEEGRLITIPNSQIAIVQNLSKEWSRVDLMIPVSYASDINQALELIEKVAEDMRNDPVWHELILEPPLLLGVDNLDHVGATVRIWIKTLPLKQWDVAREYRRRLKIAFDQSGVNIGIPQQSLQVQSVLPVIDLSNRTKD